MASLNFPLSVAQFNRTVRTGVDILGQPLANGPAGAGVAALVEYINSKPELETFRALVTSGALDNKIEFSPRVAAGNGATTESGVITFSSRAQTPLQFAIVAVQEAFHAATLKPVLALLDKPWQDKSKAYVELWMTNETQSEIEQARFLIAGISFLKSLFQPTAWVAGVRFITLRPLKAYLGGARLS
jgi:hypothetical protein